MTARTGAILTARKGRSQQNARPPRPGLPPYAMTTSCGRFVVASDELNDVVYRRAAVVLTSSETYRLPAAFCSRR